MQVVDVALIRALLQELDGEPDVACALRKALLGLIFLVQDDASPELGMLLDALLIGFPALRHGFDRELHPFIGTQPIRCSTEGGQARLLLREEFLWHLVEQQTGERHTN